jgi:hypothetical protein
MRSPLGLSKMEPVVIRFAVTSRTQQELDRDPEYSLIEEMHRENLLAPLMNPEYSGPGRVSRNYIPLLPDWSQDSRRVDRPPKRGLS